MAKRAGTYKSEKRRRELSRLKKQEEKRQRRLGKKIDVTPGDETINQEAGVEEGEGEKNDTDSLPGDS